MHAGYMLAFVVYPYIALTLFTAGHALRYLNDRYRWNARSSELLEKKQLFLGANLFHWGILLVLFGHLGGLLIPQYLLDQVGIDGATHTRIAKYSGSVAGAAALVGLGLLLFRRLTDRRVRSTTSRNDFVTVGGLVIVVGAGLYNVLASDFYVLDSVAPWIRGILIFSPDPTLMLEVPLSLKIHVLLALALLAFSPFSRLVHIWSAPVGYFLRGWIEFRRRVSE